MKVGGYKVWKTNWVHKTKVREKAELKLVPNGPYIILILVTAALAFPATKSRKFYGVSILYIVVEGAD